MSDARPLVVVDPTPRAPWMIFTDEDRARVEARVELRMHDGAVPDEVIDACLPEVSVLMGQMPLPAERLERAPRLQAVINVEGNWKPNIDYDACRRRGIWVLSVAPAMAPAVAEMCLGLAIDLARGITPADRAFRAGVERYAIASNGASFLLRGQTFGMIGFGNLGRALRPLLAPFGGRVLVHDPWLPGGLLEEHGCEAGSLEDVLEASRVLFVLAGATAENAGFLDRARLEHIREDAAVVLASRAAVVEWDAFVELAQAGRFRAAIDVFPVEPVAADDPLRHADRILVSPHRAGGLRDSYARISRMITEDLELILAGLPPTRLQRADPRTAAAGRSR